MCVCVCAHLSGLPRGGEYLSTKDKNWCTCRQHTSRGLCYVAPSSYWMSNTLALGICNSVSCVSWLVSCSICVLCKQSLFPVSEALTFQCGTCFLKVFSIWDLGTTCDCAKCTVIQLSKNRITLIPSILQNKAVLGICISIMSPRMFLKTCKTFIG